MNWNFYSLRWTFCFPNISPVSKSLYSKKNKNKKNGLKIDSLETWPWLRYREVIKNDFVEVYDSSGSLNFSFFSFSLSQNQKSRFQMYFRTLTSMKDLVIKTVSLYPWSISRFSYIFFLVFEKCLMLSIFHWNVYFRTSKKKMSHLTSLECKRNC